MILDLLLGPRPAPETRSVSLENPAISIHDPDSWDAAFGMSQATDSGELVSARRSLSLSGLWAAVKMISGDVSKLPLQTQKRQGDGLKPVSDDSHYLMPFVGKHGVANDDLSFLRLIRRVMVHSLIYENGYIWMDRNNRGKILGLYQLLSDRTGVVKYRGNLWVITEVSTDTERGPMVGSDPIAGSAKTGGRLVAKPYDEVLHIEGLCLDGLSGCDTIAHAREDIGVALASRKFKGNFFSQGLHAGGILQTPPGASGPATKKVEKAIDEHRGGGEKAFRTLVLRDGYRWFSTTIDPRAAQLRDIDEAEVRNLARRFLLAPSRLGVKDASSYNSLEMDRRDYHDTALSYWLTQIESEFNLKALTKAERQSWVIGYVVNLALLWADAKTLAAIGVQGINAKDELGRPLFKRREVRGWFGLPPDDDEPTAKTTPAQAPQPERSASPPYVEAITDALGRATRRLTVHATRAAKRVSVNGTTKPWIEFLAGLDEHRQAIEKAIDPIQNWAIELQITNRSVEVVSAKLIAELRQVLDAVTDTTSLEDLPEAVQQDIAEFTRLRIPKIASDLCTMKETT